MICSGSFHRGALPSGTVGRSSCGRPTRTGLFSSQSGITRLALIDLYCAVDQIEAILGAITILPLEAGSDRHYAAIRTILERRGAPIGANDMLIAAQARAIEAICVTDNVAEFKRVPGLKVENWLD